MVVRTIKYIDCELGHKDHATLEVDTNLGKMIVYDFSKYEDHPGFFCPGQDAISRSLFLEGQWEREGTNLISSLLDQGNKDNLFVDVGCHIGWYSRLAISKGYTTIAYDGCRDHGHLCKINVPEAEVMLLQFEEGIGECQHIINDVEVMKMDIEGAEQYAIGYFEPILNRVKNIVMEVSPVFNDSYPELLNDLKSSFNVFELNGKPFDFNYNFAQRDLWLKRKE